MLTAQKIGNDFMLDDGKYIAFAPIVEMNFVDWMKCSRCNALGWNDVVRTNNHGGFYHKCRACGATRYPPTQREAI